MSVPPDYWRRLVCFVAAFRRRLVEMLGAEPSKPAPKSATKSGGIAAVVECLLSHIATVMLCHSNRVISRGDAVIGFRCALDSYTHERKKSSRFAAASVTQRNQTCYPA